MTKGAKRTLAVLLGASLMLGNVTGTMAATKKVRAKGEKWRPVHTYIGRGDRVRWTNPTNKVHDLKAYGRGWKYTKILQPGQKATKRFKKRGTFKYRCVRHSAIVSGKCRGMCGLIHVVS
jgi:plastocyanin